MHPQLEEIVAEYGAVSDRFESLRSAVPLTDWTTRRNPDRWSVAECIAHLNLTSAAFAPLVESALARCSARGGTVPRRLRRNLPGWLLWRLSGPPVRMRVKTSAPFIPDAHRDPEEIISAFQRGLDQERGWVRRAEGLPIHLEQIVSPFDARVKYNLFAAMSILPRHELRHIWQAEQVWRP